MQNFRKFINASSSGNAAGVSGPAGASSTDNAIARWDGTTGRLLQDSGLTLSDTDKLGSANGAITFTGSGISIQEAAASGNAGVINAGGVTTTGSGFVFSTTAALNGSGLSLGTAEFIGFSNNTDYNGTIDSGIQRSAAGVVKVTDGSTGLGWLQTAGFKRKTADQTVTDSTTLVDDTHLTVSLAAGRSYKFKFILYTTTVSTSGIKVALGGTATHTDLISDIRVYDHSVIADSTSLLTDSTTVGNHTAGSTGAGPMTVTITGTTTINAAGTFLVQFAQNAETGAAESVILLRGSTLEVWDIAQ